MADTLSRDPARSQAWSAEERTLREDLAAAYRLIAHFGWDDAIYTHTTARLPGPDHHFLINPFGMTFDEICASDLVKIDIEGNVLEPTPWRVNPAGFVIHSAIHMASNDAACVMHLHTHDGVAVSCMKDGLLPINQTSLLIANAIAYHDFEGPAMNMEERKRLQDDLGDRQLMILRNHGTLAVGRTIGEMFSNMYLLERACTQQVRALAGGYDRVLFPSPEAAKYTSELMAQRDRKSNRSTADILFWPAMKRLLDRRDPSYKN